MGGTASVGLEDNNINNGDKVAIVPVDPVEWEICRRKLERKLCQHCSPLHRCEELNYFPLLSGNTPVCPGVHQSSTEPTLGIYGPRGSGKSTFIASCLMSSCHEKAIPWYFTYRDLKKLVIESGILTVAEIQARSKQKFLHANTREIPMLMQPVDLKATYPVHMIESLMEDPYVRREFLAELVLSKRVASGALWLLQNLREFGDRITEIPVEENPSAFELLHVQVTEEFKSSYKQQHSRTTDLSGKVRSGYCVVHLEEKKHKIPLNWKHSHHVIFIADLTNLASFSEGFEIEFEPGMAKINFSIVLSKVDVFRELLRSCRFVVDTRNLSAFNKKFKKDLNKLLSNDQVLENWVKSIKQEFINKTPEEMRENLRFYGPVSLVDPFSAPETLLQILGQPSMTKHFHSGLFGISDQFIPRRHLGNALRQREDVQLDPLEAERMRMFEMQ